MVNTPIPHSLKSEAKKAAKILKEFTVPSASVGPDKLIPAGLIMKAKGLAIITVVKAGFLVCARGGSGIVIAQLEDGKWSAPSAIGIAGLGGGFEIGAEITDFVFILNKSSAVDSFSKGGNLTLGGNFSIAAGPLGRSVEADVAVRGAAAIYTYSKTKGLFAGISVEGSGLIERKDTNRKFYRDESIRAYDILSGKVDPPTDCQVLYDVLENHRTMFAKAAIAYAKKEGRKQGEKQIEKKAPGALSRLKSFSFRDSKHERSPPASKSSRRDSGDSSSSYSPPTPRGSPMKDTHSRTRQVTKSTTKSTRSVVSKTSRKSSYNEVRSSWTSYTSTSSHDQAVKPRPHSGIDFSTKWDSPLKVKAIYDYAGEMGCDLSFREGEEIVVITRTDTQEDWWEGEIHGKIGIFPANYTEILP